MNIDRRTFLLGLAAAPILPDSIAPRVKVAGMEVDTTHPPRGLVLREALGILTTPEVDGKVLHHARNRAKGMYETRAVITPKGDYLLLFPDGSHYGGSAAKANDMLAYRSADKGATWQGPKLAFDIDYNQHGFVPLIPRGSQRIYAFGTQPVWGMYTRERGLQENAPIGYRYSDDDGRSWSEVKIIRPVNDPEFRGMSVTRMCETDAGTWLLGAHEGDWSYKPLLTRQYILRSDNQGKTWTLGPNARHGGWFQREFNRMDEGRLINLGGGKVLMLTRTPEGHLWELRSQDDGKTWSAPKATALVHPDAPPMVFHLSDRKTLVVFHHNRHHGSYTGLSANMEGMRDRSEVWVSTSADEGRTWREPRFVFANALGDALGNIFRDSNCSYLDMIEEDGIIHLFVPHRWERALYLRFRESDLAKFPTRGMLLQAAKGGIVKLVVLDGHTLNPGDLSWAKLESLVQLEIHELSPPHLIEERLSQADLAFTNKVRLDRHTLSRLPRLRYIGVTATGYDVVDVAAAKDRHIVVTNVPAYGTASVAQFTFALLLELCHRVGAHAASAKAEWAKSAHWSYWKSPLSELAGKMLGVAGFGRIGRQVARLGDAFGMRILAHDIRREDAPGYPGFRWADLDELFREADVVTLHCPLTPETNRLADARRLALMKSTAFLINTARGQLVVEEDLAAALASGALAGAALDVLPVEPPASGSPLFSAPNCIVTPHIAWATREARERLLSTAIENVAAFLAGRPVNVVG